MDTLHNRFKGRNVPKSALINNWVDEHHMDNVVFIPYHEKEELIYSLNAGDVHWCVNAKEIKGVSCPSKYYGIASCVKLVLGVLEKGPVHIPLSASTRQYFSYVPQGNPLFCGTIADNMRMVKPDALIRTYLG